MGVSGKVEVFILMRLGLATTMLVLSAFEAAALSNRGGAVLRIDPSSGGVDVVTLEGLLDIPFDIEIAPSGDLFVSVLNEHSIVAIDPADGTQSSVASGPTFTGLAILPTGGVFAAEVGEAPTSVLQIDPATGNATPLASTNGFARDLEADMAGNLLLGVDTVGGPFESAVIQLDASTGAQSVLSSDGLLDTILGLAVGATGEVFVSTLVPGSDPTVLIVGIDPVSGAQRVIAGGSDPGQPTYRGIAVGPDGDLFVIADSEEILRINPSTGAEQVLVTIPSDFSRWSLNYVAFDPSSGQLFVTGNVAVPEPSTGLLVAFGLATIGMGSWQARAPGTRAPPPA